MLKNLTIVLILVLGFSSIVFAAPYFRQEATIIPISDNAYDLGTTTQRWRNIYAVTASSTNLIVSGLNSASCDVKASTNGTFSCGTDATGSSFSYPFPNQFGGGNATSSLTGFSGGILVTASSTFTANTYFPSGIWNSSGNVGIGTTSPGSLLSIGGQGTGINFLDGTTATSTISGHLRVKGNLQVDGAFFAPVTLVTSGNVNIAGNLGVTGTVDLDTFTSALLLTGAGGDVAEYAGSSCTNQFVRSLSALGAATCASVNNGDWSGTDLSVLNGGTGLSSFTTNSLLYSNADGTALAFAATSTLSIGGNAATATKLLTARTINGVSFDGTANIVVASTTLLADVNTWTNTQGMSISGNAATVTTNANLTGVVTSVGNTTSFGSQTAGVLGNSATGNTGVMATSTLFGGIATFLTTGNVGIGTTTPSQLLTVSGANPYLELAETSPAYKVWDWGINTGDVYLYEDSATPRLVVKATTGNIGIGTTTPQSPLSIFASSGVNLTLDKATGAYLGFSRGGGAYNASINGLDSGDGMALNYGSSHTEAMRIDGSGNVGIGTTNPGNALDVVGTHSTTDYELLVRDSATQAAGVGAGITLFGKATDAGGYGRMGGIKAVKENGTTADYSGALTFLTPTSAGNDVLVEKMRITSAGNIGIGTTSPAQILSVGNAYANGGLYFSSTGLGIGTSTPGFMFALGNNLTVDSTGHVTAKDTPTGYTGVLSPLRWLPFTLASTTAWTGTTTGAYIAQTVIPFASTIRNVICATDAGTLNVDIYHTSTHLALFNASTTKGTITFTANNTTTAGEILYASAGTPASTPTRVDCTIGVTETP